MPYFWLKTTRVQTLFNKVPLRARRVLICYRLCTTIVPFWFSMEQDQNFSQLTISIMCFTHIQSQTLPNIVTCISSVESQKGVICNSKMFPLRTRRALLLYKVYGDSALLVLNRTSLICNNALLALNWRYLPLPIFFWIAAISPNIFVYIEKQNCVTPFVKASFTTK